MVLHGFLQIFVGSLIIHGCYTRTKTTIPEFSPYSFFCFFFLFLQSKKLCAFYDHQPTKTHSPISPLLEIRLLQKYIATPHNIAVTPLVGSGFNRGGGGAELFLKFCRQRLTWLCKQNRWKWELIWDVAVSHTGMTMLKGIALVNIVKHFWNMMQNLCSSTKKNKYIDYWEVPNWKYAAKAKLYQCVEELQYLFYFMD